MGFLDNSGDIILDAVLTDTGRMRLARGDGSFKIQKFALGDDEIDYNLYDKDHASGSAYYDLEILQTPVLEAFTNNTSTMNSKIISIPNSNLLYLPVIKLNTTTDSTSQQMGANGVFNIRVNSDTAMAEEANSFRGYGLDKTSPNPIRLDQGLDTDEISPTRALSSDLQETKYMIELDSRLIQLIPGTNSAAPAQESFIDDDKIANYTVTLATDGNFVTNNPPPAATAVDSETNQVIAGPRGTILRFRLRVTDDLVSTNYFFTLLGDTEDTDDYFIDTIVRVTGLTTGYRIDIPVRLHKNVS